MPNTATKAQIANMALGHVGVAGRIQDLDNENSEEAANCRLFFDHVRNLLLEAREWPFAKRRETLQDVGTPPDGWLFRYKYPANCALALRIVNPANRIPSAANPKIPFAITNLTDGYGKAILTDQASALLEFNEYITDTALYSATFVQAYSLGLAAHIAMPLRVDAKITKFVSDGWKLWLEEAAGHAMREQQDDAETDSEFMSGRF